MSRPILTYFDFPGGRGEAARLAFQIAGAEWVDNRFSGEWPEKKPTTPFGGLPTLEVPGLGILSQSNAILSYIGREHGLLPSDSWETARHEALMNAVEELRAQVATTARDDEDEVGFEVEPARLQEESVVVCAPTGDARIEHFDVGGARRRLEPLRELGGERFSVFDAPTERE